MVVIAIGTDHRGYRLKQFILSQNLFGSQEINWLDEGCYSSERTDYPIYAKKVCKAVLSKRAQLGLLICADGIGMSIAANRYKNIYAALAWKSEIARMSKEDDDSNILILPADFIDNRLAYECIDAWLQARFKAGRYAQRLEQLEHL